MTRRIYVTRADGRPAYENARPRLRQSHFDSLRRMPARYAALVAEAREPAELTDDPTGAVSFLAERQSGVMPGVAMAVAVVAAWAAFFLFLP